MRKFLVGSVIVVLLVAGLLSLFASSSPDGLERVAEDHGFLERGEATLAAPLPDYLFPGIANEKLATSCAGLVGAGITLGAGYLIAKGLASRKEVKG